MNRATYASVWPASFVWWSTKDRGFYWQILVLGLAVFLAALRLVERPERRWDAAWMGLAAGLGLWESPQIAFFVRVDSWSISL